MSTPTRLPLRDRLLISGTGWAAGILAGITTWWVLLAAHTHTDADPVTASAALSALLVTYAVRQVIVLAQAIEARTAMWRYRRNTARWLAQRATTISPGSGVPPTRPRPAGGTQPTALAIT